MKTVLMLADRPKSPSEKYAAGSVQVLEDALADHFIGTGVARFQSYQQTDVDLQRDPNTGDLNGAAKSAKDVLTFVTAKVDGLTGGVDISSVDANLAGLFGGPTSRRYISTLQNALASAFALRNMTTAPTYDETNPTFNVGTRYYIDPIAGNNANNGTSPATPWADLWKLSGLNPGAGAIIHIAADAVFDYADTWATYKARTKFPYNGADSLNGSSTQPVIVRPYFPRASSQKKPVVRWYAAMQSADWTQEAGYGGNVWSAAFSLSGNTYVKTQVAYGANNTLMEAQGHNNNGPAALSGVGQYAVDATKVYVYSPGGANPVDYYGGVKVFGLEIFGTAWNGLRYFKLLGMRFELCRAMNLDFAANVATVHGGVEIAYCDFVKARAAFIRNQQAHATPQELSVSVHDNYFEDVPGGAVHFPATTGTAGNTVSWEFYLNSASRANLNSGFGAVLYNQSKGGTKHIAWGNYGYDCRNGAGGTNIDGSFLYSDVSADKSIFVGNIAERCGVAFQTNSALGCHVVANLAIDCWKHTQTTGTGTDNTPNMVCNVVHNTWIWTGRIAKSDLRLGSGVSSDTTGIFTQWNDQNASGRKYANYAFLNNLAINASDVVMTRPMEYHVSAGITTATIGGNAAFGLSGVLIKDDTTDVSTANEHVTLTGTTAEAATLIPGVKKGGFRPSSGSTLCGAGVPLSVQYTDITGRNFAAVPTPGCFEASR